MLSGRTRDKGGDLRLTGGGFSGAPSEKRARKSGKWGIGSGLEIS